MVDVNGLHRMHVSYCRCPGARTEPFQLLAASFYPATWTSPQTAFTIRLLKHYHLDSLQSRKPAYDYWAILRRLTDNTRAKGLPVRYEELLRVSREWRHLARLKRSGQGLGIAKHLPHQSNSVAVTCPACPEPGFNMPDDWQETLSPSNFHTSALYLGMDGNFRAVVIQKRHDVDDRPLLDGRGYFVDSDVNVVYESAGQQDPNEHKSTCSNLRSMTALTKRKGIVVSGVIVVVCSRHSAYRPGSMVDMKVGEKFALNDLSLAGALGPSPHPALPRFLLCDKGCQYGVRLTARFEKTFPNLSSIVGDMNVLVNKMHLQGHQEDCRFRFSPQYTVGCGRTDGEGVERPWPHSNETAKITKDQNPGHRKDTFDDTNSDWNYRKLIDMVSSLLNKIRDEQKKRAEADSNFAILNNAIDAGLIAEWEGLSTEPQLVSGEWKSVYRGNREKMPKRSELVAALVRKEAEEARALGNLNFEKTYCSTTFLDSALNLETKQRRLVEFRNSLPESPSKQQLMQLCLRRSDLRDDLTSFRMLQAIHMPVLGSAPTSDDFSTTTGDVDDDFGCPEDEPLSIPSDWGAAEDRQRLGFAKLGERELVLRQSAADSELASMKLAIQASNSALTFKQKNVRGYGPVTRAEESVNSNRKKIMKHANAYRRHYKAMVALGLPNDLKVRYQDLDDKDLGHLHISAMKPAQLGESQLPQAWFWAGDRDPDVPKDQKSLDELSREELRVRWFRARAHRDRCREEVEILQAELARTLATFRRMHEIWETVASEQTPGVGPEALRAEVVEGRRAYALKQAAIYEQRVRHAEEGQSLAGKILAGQVIGKKRNVAGAEKPEQETTVDKEWSYY